MNFSDLLIRNLLRFEYELINVMLIVNFDGDNNVEGSV